MWSAGCDTGSVENMHLTGEDRPAEYWPPLDPVERRIEIRYAKQRIELAYALWELGVINQPVLD